MGTRIQALALYRSMLRVSRRMDYQYGHWNTAHIIDLTTLRPKQVNKMARRKDFGNVVWNNVRAQYKTFQSEENDDNVAELLDYGFDALRTCNEMHTAYETFKIAKKRSNILLLDR